MTIELTDDEVKLVYDIIKERENYFKEHLNSKTPFINDFAERILYRVTPLKEKIKKLLPKEER